MVLLDFSKAFDKAPHQRLLHVLSHYGIRGPLHTWIKNFLIHRTQQTVVNGTKSDVCSVLSGVPQGTVLGPLLFLLYINVLPNIVQSQIRLFADDSILYIELKSTDFPLILQHNLDQLYHWSKAWQMEFNVTKCYVMSFTRKKSPTKTNYFLNEIQLKSTNTHPYLGVYLSSDLRWNIHYSHISKKANRTLGFLRRNFYHELRTSKVNSTNN